MKLYIAALLLFMPLLIFFEAFEAAYDWFISWYSQVIYVQEAYATGVEPPPHVAAIGHQSFPLFLVAFLKAAVISGTAIALIRLKPRVGFLPRLAILSVLMLVVQYPFGFYQHFDTAYRLISIFLCGLLFLTPSLLIATRLLRKPATSQQTN